MLFTVDLLGLAFVYTYGGRSNKYLLEQAHVLHNFFVNTAMVCERFFSNYVLFDEHRIISEACQ